MHHNFMQIEGVANLHLLPPTGALLSIGFAKVRYRPPQTWGVHSWTGHGLPDGYIHSLTHSLFAKVRGGTGGYARIVAICPPDHPHEAPGAPLPEQAYPLRRDKNGVLTPAAGASPTEYCAPGATGSLGCPLPAR